MGIAVLSVTKVICQRMLRLTQRQTKKKKNTIESGAIQTAE